MPIFELSSIFSAVYWLQLYPIDTLLELTSLDGDGISIDKHFKFQRDLKHFNLCKAKNNNFY